MNPVPTWIVSAIVIAVAAFSVIAVMYFVVKENVPHDEHFNPALHDDVPPPPPIAPPIVPEAPAPVDAPNH